MKNIHPEQLPSWRIDNIIPIIGMVLTLVINIGALFWWGGRLSLGQDLIVKNQEQQYNMWLKLEGRVGHLEIVNANRDGREGR